MTNRKTASLFVAVLSLSIGLSSFTARAQPGGDGGDPQQTAQQLKKLFTKATPSDARKSNGGDGTDPRKPPRG